MLTFTFLRDTTFTNLERFPKYPCCGNHLWEYLMLCKAVAEHKSPSEWIIICPKTLRCYSQVWGLALGYSTWHRVSGLWDFSASTSRCCDSVLLKAQPERSSTLLLIPSYDSAITTFLPSSVAWSKPMCISRAPQFEVGDISMHSCSDGFGQFTGLAKAGANVSSCLRSSSGKAPYWNASAWAFAGEAEPPEHCSVTWDVFGWKMSGSVLVWKPFDPSPKTQRSRGPGALPWVTIDTLGSAEQNGLSTSQKVLGTHFYVGLSI